MISTEAVTCGCGEEFSPMRITCNDDGTFTWCPECLQKMKIGDSYQYEQNQKKKKEKKFKHID